jgi:hypothetical protein
VLFAGVTRGVIANSNRRVAFSACSRGLIIRVL